MKFENEEQASKAYVAQMRVVTNVCRALRILDVDSMLATISRAHAIAPITDPTGYKAGMKNLSDQERILRKLKDLLDEMDAVERRA